MPVGLRVFTQRGFIPAKEIVEQFKDIPASNIADCMGRSCAMSTEIKLMTKPMEKCMAGPAITVKARPGDNLMIHKSIDMAVEGDIIVISNEGDRSHSLLGEIVVALAKVKKVAGIVLDGPMRDVTPIFDLGIPVYATGATPGGPYKEGPGEINVPIACGGIAVNPGDLIIGDSDGVIVVPKHDAESLLKKAIDFSKNDNAKVQAAYNGTADRSWVEKAMISKGVEIIDGSYTY